MCPEPPVPLTIRARDPTKFGTDGTPAGLKNNGRADWSDDEFLESSADSQIFVVAKMTHCGGSAGCRGGLMASQQPLGHSFAGHRAEKGGRKTRSAGCAAGECFEKMPRTTLPFRGVLSPLLGSRVPRDEDAGPSQSDGSVGVGWGRGLSSRS